jgi:hypothetical protein
VTPTATATCGVKIVTNPNFKLGSARFLSS